MARPLTLRPVGVPVPEFVTSDGVRLRYADEGTGDPVVLVAGFKAPATSWLFQQPHLVERGYRVLALDRRGHGASEAPEFGNRMARHGRDLGEFLAALDLGTGRAPVLVGGSMGASTIWAYLDQHGAGAVRGIVGVDQTPRMSNEDGWEHGFYGYGADNLGTYFAAGPPMTGHGTPVEERGERLTRVVQALFGPATDEDEVVVEAPEPVAADDAADAGGPPPLTPGELALLRDHAVQDWRDVVARVGVPALYVAGRDSEFWPCEHATAMAASNPLARAVVLEDCGHAANIERYEQFNAALDDFLASLD